MPEQLRQISDFEERYKYAFCGKTADEIRDSVLGMILAAAIETATHTPFSGTLDKTLYVFTGSPAETIMSLLPEEHGELFGRVAKYDHRTRRLTINNMYLKNLLVLMNRWDTAEHILYLLPDNVKTQLLSTFIKLAAKRTNKMSKNPSKGSQEHACYAVYYSSTNDRFVLLKWIHSEIKRRNITGVNVLLSPTPKKDQYALNLTIYSLQNALEEIAASENQENALSLHDVVLRVMTT